MTNSHIIFTDREPLLPFIKWVGGKQKILDQIIPYLPKDISSRKYWEPFVGAGSLFFALQPEVAVLSDANGHLIDCYKQVRDNFFLVHKYLSEHAKKHSEKHFYETRALYNRSRPSASQSARFIYLNKACFNGIFRVNLKGDYNVPYGWKDSPVLPSLEMLEKISGALKNISLRKDSYEKTYDKITSSDFIYLDPPYPPLNGTSYFTHYTAERFGESDQQSLAEYIKLINAKRSKFMLSIADTPLTRNLYKNYFSIELSVTRWITCKSKKHRVSELLITNYESFIKDR